MGRVFVRSRRWNLVLCVVGAVYAVVAAGVLLRLAIEVWNTSAIIDMLMQIALVAAAACGVWFVLIALENLGYRRTPHKAHK